MFEEKENPGYETLSQDAKRLIVKWSRNSWYESSFEDHGKLDEAPSPDLDIDSGEQLAEEHREEL